MQLLFSLMFLCGIHNALCDLLAAAWTAVCRWIHPDPPRYRPHVYGYLQGTFGLPYGGYLIQPPAPLRQLVLTEHRSMFSVIGSHREILQCLRHLRVPVFSQMRSRSYTADLVIELYRHRMPPISSIMDAVRWLASPAQRQLVIRAGRTFVPREFKPLARIQVPQGLALDEMAGVLEDLRFRGTHDLTRNKAINISVMGRLAQEPTKDESELPKYQPTEHRPPAYSL